MNILDTLKQLRDDIKVWVTNNLNALNTKIDEKTIPIDSELSSTSTNAVQNKAVKKAIDNIPRFSGSYNDLTDAPNIAEDDSGNMVIADESGNIIFKADAEGIHTTAVSLNGEAAATEKYVDEAVANIDIPEVDFAGYATEDFVANAIDSVKEELGESITTEGDDWKIVDNDGNIIFSIDAEGAHTTSLTLNGETVEDIVDSRLASLVDSAPDTLNTLNELAAALGDDPNFATTIATEIGNKVDKVEGKGLSTNDFTDEYKLKLEGLENITFEETDPTVPAWAKAETKPTYTSAEVGLGNVDNTSDADKPVSTATQNAIDDLRTELSESIVSESNEWKIVDNAGNIILSVDATGAHTTELTLNGESAATESYVDDAIANIEFPTTDLTNYATKKYVDDAVNGIEIPDVDFTGYATETYVDNKVADLVNSAPEALNTLGELAEALENHEDAYDALLETVGSKATHTDLENLKEELSESIVAETDEWKVVDENGNIIFSVDADGAHTTSLTLNGQSVEDIIDDKVDKVDGKGLSTNDFTNAYREKLDGLENITFEETDPTVPAWAKEANKPSYTADEVGALADTTVLADLTDDATHRTVTDTEKATWNAKSDFSGDYNDLENAPNITEDGTGDLVIADVNGNIIFRSNGDGFETVNLTVQNITINGMTIQDMVRSCVEEVILGGEW